MLAFHQHRLTATASLVLLCKACRVVSRLAVQAKPLLPATALSGKSLLAFRYDPQRRLASLHAPTSQHRVRSTASLALLSLPGAASGLNAGSANEASKTLLPSTAFCGKRRPVFHQRAPSECGRQQAWPCSLCQPGAASGRTQGWQRQGSKTLLSSTALSGKCLLSTSTD